MDYFFVVGRTADGATVYYTGKAGHGFISKGIGDAFMYGSLDEARRRAGNLNRATPTHGIRFFAPVDLGEFKRGESVAPETEGGL